eukprot:TRINITY_DN3146_c0_g1_i1.p1 TRINITY_DN3146_c0_g1~~TRINITY_DN3146_c0_g1_i1.p1  ORF type:complete len:246 (-),score=34.45 TRINITY_DN3146_c0_g1_i1:214-951(-)
MGGDSKIVFKSLKVEHALNDKVTGAKTVVSLPKSVKATFGYKLQRKEAALELEHDNWEFKYNTKSKDVEGKLKFKTDIGKLKIKQKVVNSQFKDASFKPILELETSLLKRDEYKDKLELSYDTSTKVAAMSETIKYKDRHEIKVKVDSKAETLEDLILSGKSNVSKSILNDVGFEYSKKSGPVLKAEIGVFDGAELDLDYYLKTNQLALSLEYTRDSTIFEVGATVNTSDMKLEPKTKFGVKYNF